MKSAQLKIMAAAVSLVMVLAAFLVAFGADDSSVKYKDAASYYKDAKCVVCHGPKGDKKIDASKTDDEMVQIILKGKKVEKPPHMPGYEAKGITADQAKELLAYMKSLKK